ncbi:hypothetical protein OK074_8523 [Actinobacteria bacterium OK074]|nr:hypothetical protein OK074_8523 [Actinobacteria bacterium OK074]
MSLGDEPGWGEGTPRSDHDGGYGGTGQTRTRYPDDPYGTPRKGRTGTSRSMVTVVGVVVLLIAAIAFANRGDGNDSSTASSGSSGSGSDTAAAPPTAPTGTKPVQSKVADIPSGYAHTQQGAQSAAANYAVALGSADMFDATKRAAIVQTVYAPSVAADRQSQLDKTYASAKFLESVGLNSNGAAPSGQTFVSRVAPVGTDVTKSSGDDSVTVAVWYTSLFGLSGDSSTNPVTESWYTTTYDLTWADGDWKVTDSDQKDGPVPAGRDQTASTAEDMTKAVEEFGGFTYAR